MSTRTLAEEQEARKQRLQELKQKSLKRPAEVQFKSYIPDTESLQKHVTSQPELGPTAKDTVETHVEIIRKEILENQDHSVELDLNNLKPKKLNWDLKRDLEEKMKKLDRLTTIAITDLIRTRLQESGELEQ